MSDFNVPETNFKIEKLLKEYDLWFDCWIDLSEPKCLNNDIQNIISRIFMPLLFDNDYINFKLLIYNDSEYQNNKLSENKNSYNLKTSKK